MLSTFLRDLDGLEKCLFLAVCEVIWNRNGEIFVVDVVKLHNSLNFCEKCCNGLFGEDLTFLAMCLNLEESLILLASKRSRIELPLFLQVSLRFNSHISLRSDDGVVQI